MKKYIFGAVLSLGILVSPAFTHAGGLTNEQINSILGLLSSFGADQATINNVQISLNGGTPTTGGGTRPWCHTFNTDLTIGSSDDDVSALDQVLPASGINRTSKSSTFDENTAADIVSFQAKYGIKQTGYVGPITRAKLNALYGCPTNFPPTPPPFPPQPPQPSITVLSPNGGESYAAGTSIPFYWVWNGVTAPVQPAVYLYRVDLGKVVYGSISSSDIPYNPTSQKQTGNFGAVLHYPNASPPDFVPGGQYKLKVCEYPEGTNNSQYPTGAPACDFSDSSFTITAPATSGIGLKVMLSPTSPNGTVLFAGQSIGDLADFTFSNPTASPINVTGLSFKRTGVSNDSTMTNVYLYNAGTRLTASAGVSASAFSFSDPAALFTVPAGGSYTVSVRSDIATGTSGQQIGVQLVSVASNGMLDASVVFPINGGFQTISAANSTPLTLTSITPSSGPVGTSIRLDGCGSDSSSGFTLVYTGPKSGTAVIPVETLGAASGCGYMTITVPADFPAGVYTLQVQNNQTGAMSTNSEAFTVTAPSITNNPHLSLSASSIVQGDSLVTTVTGATPNTAFSIYANGPTNTYSAGMTDASGQFSRTDSTVGLTAGTYSAWVTVNSVQSNTVSFTITARPASPATLTVTPSNASVQEGGTQQFIAMYDPDGAGSLSPIDVTASASWFASPSATVSKGLATGQSSGDAFINAIYSGITKSVSIHVTAPTQSTPITLTNITPSSGPVGTSIRLDGCGSDSTSGFTLYYKGPVSGSTSIPVETLGAASGCGYMTITVPADFPAGAYTLQVQNNQTGAMSTNSQAFTVTAPAVANNPVASVSPTSVAVGASFTSSITGATPNTQIRIFSTDPRGVTSEDTPGTTDSSGKFSRTYNTNGWMGGSYRGWVTVNGVQSNVVTFNVGTGVTTTAPVVSLSSSSTVQGGMFVVSVSGAPNAVVKIFCRDPNGASCDDAVPGTTDTNGKFSRSYATSGWTLGTYRGWVTVNGVQSNTVGFIITASVGLSGGASQMASVFNAVGGSVLGNSTSQAPATTFTYVWDNNLQIGSPLTRDVKALQTALTRDGEYAGDLTGGFYSQTYAAVKAFQEKHGIEATGFVGPLTRAQLNTLFAR